MGAAVIFFSEVTAKSSTKPERETHYVLELLINCTRHCPCREQQILSDALLNPFKLYYSNDESYRHDTGNRNNPEPNRNFEPDS